MKIVAISDTHIPSQTKTLPKKLYEAFKKADLIIHAGDITEFFVLEEIKKFCPHIKAVCGNMDSNEIKDKLPCKEIITVNNYKIGIIHGQGHPANLIELITKNFSEDKVDIIIFGHSHQPFKEFRNNVIYFNPGSPTDKIFTNINSYGIIEITNNKIEAEIIKI